jgi:hypothetical protein
MYCIFVLDDNEKRVKALTKKIEQIKKLVEKKDKGEKLEKNQVSLLDVFAFKESMIFVIIVNYV